MAAMDIPAGTVIDAEMLSFKRPGHGVSPADIKSVIGKQAKLAICTDTIIQYDMLK